MLVSCDKALLRIGSSENNVSYLTGNFPTNDLQQVSTAVVEEKQQAVRVLADVCSVYPERNEALVNAGAIALSRETSAVPGFGRVVDKPDWHIVRLSQEHGILGIPVDREYKDNKNVLQDFHVNDKVFLYCQHSCITAAAFHVYYVVDESDVVCDTWVPWKGW
jgi:D-serine deaminase-like pyridoxal phosphate-dependent protein